MEVSQTCAECGGPLLDGSCPVCDQQPLYRFVHRELVILAVLAGIAVLAFLGTRRAALANQAMRRQDAAAWYAIGQRRLAAGDPAAAVTAFQQASSAAPLHSEYRLALARALSANQQDDAARQVLLGVRQTVPEDADVNAQLARLEARRNVVDSAVRYYRSALYGRWTNERLGERRRLRIELIRFLLQHEQPGRALSELLVLSDGLPDDAQLQLEVGRLYRDAGDLRRAQAHFGSALQVQPQNADALAEAGQVAFDLGDYARARSILERVRSPSAQVLAQLALTEQVLALDPMLPRLSAQERRRRVLAGLQRVILRLESCASSGPPDDRSRLLASLATEGRAFARRLTLNAVQDAPVLIEAGKDEIARLGQSVPAGCGPLTLPDRAWQHIVK